MHTPIGSSVKVLVKMILWLTNLSVFGLQPQLVPADGLNVSGLGQDLDPFRGLHQQRPGRGLQPGRKQQS